MHTYAAADRDVSPRGEAHPSSFRDPSGRLVTRGNRVLRIVNSRGFPDATGYLDSTIVGSLMESGRLVGTRRLDGAELQTALRDPHIRTQLDTGSRHMILEHERIAFPSFPYEWPPEMLHYAATITLELALDLLPDGLGLKDATPYNVLFRGPDPVFVDVLSVERRQPGDSSWLPYAQFIRTFLLPLLANRQFGLALDQMFLTRRDGIEPEEVYRWAGPLQRLLPPLLSLVTIPTWLGRRHNQDDQAIYRRKLDTDHERAQFVLRAILKGLQRTLRKLCPRSGRRSVWSDYLGSNNNYSPSHFEAKKSFVEWAINESRSTRVLDVGCNTGFFSAVAARAGAQVVAIDSDAVVVGEAWRKAREEHLDILPLVVNLTRPTPSAGWRNSECASFLDRARGKFDAVLMLAVVHHMLVTERVPLAEIVSLAAELTTDLLVVEFVAPQDSMFVRLARGREELHRDLNSAVFEDCLRAHFDIAKVEHIPGTYRWLYALRKRKLKPKPPVIAFRPERTI